MTHNFYPGPSTIHPRFEASVQEALRCGILSQNHRSNSFATLYQECLEVLRDRLNIPNDFQLLFVSSATETWEILAQSLFVDEPSLHIYNGAFGKKSFDVTNKITEKASTYSFNFNECITIHQLEEFPFISLCQNETSNGTHIKNSSLELLRKRFPNAIISIDATSSLGGYPLDFNNADIWYGSVQKCLGLPSGMGIILINEKAKGIVQSKNINTHYNDLSNLLTNSGKWQTTHTPNILNIHALMHTQKYSDNIMKIHETLIQRKEHLVKNLKQLHSLPSIPTLISDTVLTFSTPYASQLIQKAHDKDLIIGKGYGKWLESTFRVANFPYIANDSFEVLLEFLNSET